MGGLAWWRLRRWRWHALVPLTAVPVLIGVGLLQLLGPIGGPLSPEELAFFKGGLTPDPFLAGILTLVGVLSIHVCVCLCGIALALGMLRRHKAQRAHFTAFAAGSTAAAIVLILLLEQLRRDGP